MPALPGLLLIFGAMSASLAAVARFGDEDGPGARGLYGLLIGCWGILGIVYGLLAIGAFHWAVVGAIGVGLALAAYRIAPDAGRAVLRVVGAEIGGWSWLAKVTAAATGGVVLLTTARAVGRPPFGWDAVTYHLVHAGRWVRDGAFTREHHPDAWAYYEVFPTGGDVLWALFMLGDGTTDYLFLGAILGHLLAAAGVYALMRAGGLPGTTAALATAAVMAASPTLLVAAWMYVDGIALGLASAAAAATILALRRPSTLGAFAVGAGIVCAVAVKTSQLPLFALIPLLLVAFAVGRRRRIADVGSALLPLVVLAPEWVEKLLSFGNPLYPFGLPLLGGAEPMLASTMRGELAFLGIGSDGALTARDVLTAAALILTPIGASMASQLPAFALLLPVAIVGAARDLRSRPGATTALVLLFVTSTLMFVMPSSWGLVVLWHASVARFILPAWAVVLLLSGRALSPPISAAAFVLVTVGGLFLELRNADLELLPIGIVLGSAVAIAALAWSPLRERLWAWASVSAGAALALQLLSALPLRTTPIGDDPRNPVVHLHERYTPVRLALRDAPPALIATDFDYESRFLGHDAMRTWLMGRRSQHRLVTISRWQSGALHPQWRPPPVDDALDPAAWRRRLLASDADWLYVQGPDNPTWKWAAGDPAFELIATTEGYNALFRVHDAQTDGAARVPAPRHRQPQTAKLRETTNPEP